MRIRPGSPGRCWAVLGLAAAKAKPLVTLLDVVGVFLAITDPALDEGVRVGLCVINLVSRVRSLVSLWASSASGVSNELPQSSLWNAPATRLPCSVLYSALLTWPIVPRCLSSTCSLTYFVRVVAIIAPETLWQERKSQSLPMPIAFLVVRHVELRDVRLATNRTIKRLRQGWES